MGRGEVAEFDRVLQNSGAERIAPGERGGRTLLCAGRGVEGAVHGERRRGVLYAVSTLRVAG